MSDIAEKLQAEIAMDEQWAKDTAESVARGDGGEPHAPDVPGHHLRVLRRCAADREIVGEVMSWKHFYLDGDTWYSCGLSVDPAFPDEGPGSGCANDSDIGQCTCGLEYRRNKILAPLARGYGLEVDGTWR